MKLFLTVLSLTVLATPVTATEPFPGFADRLVMACNATGVVNVFFSEDGTLTSYQHTRQANKKEAQSCLLHAYKKIAATPTPVSAPSSASHFTVLKDGTIKLY